VDFRTFQEQRNEELNKDESMCEKVQRRRQRGDEEETRRRRRGDEELQSGCKLRPEALRLQPD